MCCTEVLVQGDLSWIIKESPTEGLSCRTEVKICTKLHSERLKSKNQEEIWLYYGHVRPKTTLKCFFNCERTLLGANVMDNKQKEQLTWLPPLKTNGERNTIQRSPNGYLVQDQTSWKLEKTNLLTSPCLLSTNTKAWMGYLVKDQYINILQIIRYHDGIKSLSQMIV